VNQKQTNILIVFLTVLLVLFAAYPLVKGGYPPTGDTFSACVIIILAILITLIYSLIFEPNPQKISNNETDQKLSLILKTIAGSVIFLVSCSMVAILLFPKNIVEIEIGILAGIISGMYISIFQKS
jgi:membrane protease YdiL (CAAX protease family)